ncbi:MAG: helix-turn-helix domain-containing protein [Oscillospiraceae bacterium]|nr:helix-turn-helix domain-containing protein [Oscillospiraceae bacterium]
MLYMAENLKTLRKGSGLTQEEAAEILGISAQSVSKWERGDTLPDITLLPALANLYKVSVDELIGMDKINARTIDAVFVKGHRHLRDGDTAAAITVYSDALKIFPNNEGIMSDLAMTLALSGDKTRLPQAVSLCERVLSADTGEREKIRHTIRAALCFIYMKQGEKDKAIATARNLPHVREGREIIMEHIENGPAENVIDTYLKFLAIGEK